MQLQLDLDNGIWFSVNSLNWINSFSRFYLCRLHDKFNFKYCNFNFISISTNSVYLMSTNTNTVYQIIIGTLA